MMKLLVVFAVFCVANIYCDEYTSKFNKIDLEAVMKNDRLLKSHFECLISGTGCTPEGEELKAVVPEAIETGCAKCTDEHKKLIKKMVIFLVKEKREMWDKLVEKYDPGMKYKTKWADALKAEGLEI